VKPLRLSLSRWRWPLAGALAAAAFLVLCARFWHPAYGFTVFFQLDGSNDPLKLTEFRQYPVYVHRDNGGYDGLYYAQIAFDPTLQDPELPRAMDNFAYRARRILPPALAWTAGFGQPRGIIFAYSILNLCAWLACAALVWRLLAVNNARAFLAWSGVMFSAGALASVRLALTDLPALTLLAAMLVALERGQRNRATAWLASAALARETSLAALPALWTRPWFSRRNALAALAVIAPLAGWLVYVRFQVGPADAGWGNLTWPVAGWIEKLIASVHALGTVGDHTLAWTTFLAFIALSAQAAAILVHRRPNDPHWRIGFAYTVLLLTLGTAVWEGFPGAATRVLLPLTLAANILLIRSRAPLAWLIVINLTVPAGLLSLRDVPADVAEVAAASSRHGTAVARRGEGWYPAEAAGRSSWNWTRGRAEILLESWGDRDAIIDLSFKLRALRPCVIGVSVDGSEIARLNVGPTLEKHVVHINPAARIKTGAMRIGLASDTEPVAEGNAPEARQLGFALYDPRLEIRRR
jgi:hypothetical protein